ncbi:patatin-like phospholipase family protein [Caldibacillus lycopersici]|uniref:Patatin-like phospholipase family protein n=1 Tax=Perspicuibacillus lycopersici TaxID=1325689 RepID=A0AAE3IPJ0_9BACI|nr:patatin-like phospholipase family protein [Perspicuibacillus lycopersici]MCU9612218.1 patatin-like phospholipase family protein [Perspicuibacillus lycopersici]
MDFPKIGLALGSGGARGLAHIGVIKVLEEANIPIHMIAGSSIGSLIGAFYAAGHNVEEMLKITSAFKRKYFLDITIPKLGFIAGNRIKDFIRLFTYNKNIEDLSIPLAITATDIHTGEKVIFKQGPIADAVRASIAIPGIFVPETWNGRVLVDGGVIDRVPVSVVKEMGAEIIIAVDVAGLKKNASITTIYDVILQSIDIMQLELVKNRENQSDIMIQPIVEQFGSYSFGQATEIILAGEEAAKKYIDTIKSLISRWKESHQ